MRLAHVDCFKGDELKRLEARGGIEPPNKGFADLCLTTWLPRQRGATLFLNLPRCLPDGSRERNAPPPCSRYPQKGTAWDVFFSRLWRFFP